jgi:hypothetical protein
MIQLLGLHHQLVESQSLSTDGLHLTERLEQQDLCLLL